MYKLKRKLKEFKKLLPVLTLILANNLLNGNIYKGEEVEKIERDNQVVQVEELGENDVVGENIVLEEDDVLVEDTVIKDEDVLEEDDVLLEDTVIKDEDVLVEDTVIKDEDVLEEDTVIKDEDVLVEDTVIKYEDVLVEDTVIKDEDVLEEDNAIKDEDVLVEDVVLEEDTVIEEDEDDYRINNGFYDGFTDEDWDKVSVIEDGIVDREVSEINWDLVTDNELPTLENELNFSDMKIKEPQIYVRSGATLTLGEFKKYEDFNSTELMNYEYVKRAYYEHMQQLLDSGVNINNIEDFQIVIDSENITFGSSGYYVYTTEKHTTNPKNFTKNTVGISLHVYKDSYENIKNTFIHEFGHHIGFSELHYNGDYSFLHELRNGEIFFTNHNKGKYDSNWRNKMYEQFAETYMELYVPHYNNNSATPNLTHSQSYKLLVELQKRFK